MNKTLRKRVEDRRWQAVTKLAYWMMVSESKSIKVSLSDIIQMRVDEAVCRELNSLLDERD